MSLVIGLGGMLFEPIRETALGVAGMQAVKGVLFLVGVLWSVWLAERILARRVFRRRGAGFRCCPAWSETLPSESPIGRQFSASKRADPALKQTPTVGLEPPLAVGRLPGNCFNPRRLASHPACAASC